jgi:hypothetical protein
MDNANDNNSHRNDNQSVCHDRRIRHERLLAPVFLVGALTWLGTDSIPASNGTPPCLAWGFARGIVNAWLDFILGMVNIELAQAQHHEAQQQENESGPLTPPQNDDDDDNDHHHHDGRTVHSSSFYEDAVATLTAQSRTALNAGSLVASSFTFIFYWIYNEELTDRSVSWLLYLTSLLYGVAALLAMAHRRNQQRRRQIAPPECQLQSLVTRALAAAQSHERPSYHQSAQYECIRTDDDEAHHFGPARTGDDLETCAPSPSSSCHEQQELGPVSVPLLLSSLLPSHDGAGVDAPLLQRLLLTDQQPAASRQAAPPPQKQQQHALLESFALVAFQLLLAATALRALIVSFVGMVCWTALMVFLLMLLVVTLFLGYSAAASSAAAENDREQHQQQSARAIPYYRLHLYFLLRNALPSAGSVMSSFVYTVFAAEPLVLQMLSLGGSAFGTLATMTYEKYLAQYNKGRPLLVLMVVLNVAAGLAGLLDLVIIRSVEWQRQSDDMVVAKVTFPFLLLLAVVEVAQSFAGELDYLPTAILSASNVRDATAAARDDPAAAMPRLAVTSMNVEGVDVDGSSSTALLQHNTSSSWTPSYNTGMQYASFLSSIDFGFQVAEWVAIPIMATLHVTRESNWANLGSFVALCGVLQLGRPLLLCLLQPPSATTTTSRRRST